MNSLKLPEDCSKQWEILLLLLSSEEKKIDRTGDNEVEVMNYFYKNEGVRKILQQWLLQMHSTYAKTSSNVDTATKSDDISLYWRQKGNECFRNNAIDDSYTCYTKSVLFAVPSGEMYPLALANRSAALLRLKRFEDCLSDIELALKHGYPDSQWHKLYLRQADCHTELRQSSEAAAALDQARHHAEGLKLPANHANDFDRYLKLIKRKLEALGGAERPPEPEPVLLCHRAESKDFVNASEVIELRRSESAGRHVVTREATRRGDVMFSEEPYAFVALPVDGDLPVVCEACCRGDLNSVPCDTCSRAVYCGEACRARAWSAHHRWECVGAQSRLFPTIGVAHLALRVLLVAASEGLPPLPAPAPAPAHAPDAAAVMAAYARLDPVKVYAAGTPPFQRMFHLVTNFDKMNNVDYIQYALTATMLTLYLETFTSFFSYFPSRLPCALPEQQVRLLAAALVLRAMGQLVCNGHAALSLADSPGTSRTVTEREVRHATAIYPSAAMMNHSCDPNIINTFYRHRLIIRCGRELPAGSEVLNCYGPHRAREPTSERRAQLRAQYHFTCSCDACSTTGPRDNLMVFNAYACQSCKGPVWWGGRRALCQQCHRELAPERLTSLLQTADTLDAQAEAASSLDERCDKATQAYKLRQQALHRHNSRLRAAADRLARLHAEMDDYSKSVELIKQNIQSLEYQFGSFSFEVAHELCKLADVMLERMFHAPQHPDYRDWCLEAHKIIKKAHQLMELNYGPWEKQVRRLKTQEEAAAALLAVSKAQGPSDYVHHNLHYNLKI